MKKHNQQNYLDVLPGWLIGTLTVCSAVTLSYSLIFNYSLGPRDILILLSFLIGPIAIIFFLLLSRPFKHFRFFIAGLLGSALACSLLIWFESTQSWFSNWQEENYYAQGSARARAMDYRPTQSLSIHQELRLLSLADTVVKHADSLLASLVLPILVACVYGNRAKEPAPLPTSWARLVAHRTAIFAWFIAILSTVALVSKSLTP